MEINFYTTQSNQNDYNIYEYNLCDFHWKIVAFYVFAVKFVEKTKDLSYFKIIIKQKYRNIKNIMGNLFFYITSVIIITLIPGPDLIFLITQGLTKGRKEAVFTALGLSSGCLFHTALAALGVAIIFKQSIIAFNILKILGIIYLFYLAIKAYKNADKFSLETTSNQAKSGFFKGILMNILNPKVILFYLAFIPQFVPKGTQKVGLYMLFLGLIFMAIAVIILTTVAVLSAKLNDILLKKPDLMVKINKISAFILLLLAIALAFTQN